MTSPSSGMIRWKRQATWATMAATLAAAGWLAGCTTAPAVDPGVFVPSPLGKVTVFNRKSSGSFGSGESQVRWTHEATTWEGRPVVKAKIDGGPGNLLEPQTYAMVAMLNPAGQPTMSFDPPLGYGRTLKVGDSWTAQHTVTVYPSMNKVPYQITYKVLAYEKVTVPAGTFDTFKVESTDSAGETVVVWTAPAIGQNVIRRIQDRSAQARQGIGHQEGELAVLQLPPK